ncbi:MAG: hypothetical protein OEZ41_04670 [Nitrospirota bacterium]|nr:hypothetical protein [Nitrospirota bacterium]MDH5699239.1 hypothetical protein [Nitrospirota bacterium]
MIRSNSMKIVILLLTLGLTGCILHPRPNVAVYPNKNQTATQVAKDKSDCRAWADEESGYTDAGDHLADVGGGAAVGALGGAAAGAIIGAVAGSPGTGAAFGAAVGGVGGAGMAGSHGYIMDYGVYNRAYALCMNARQYAVN